MKKSVAIIVGGTGQFGFYLSKKLIAKKYLVIVTTRSIKKAKSKIKSNNNLLIKKLNILNKIQIKSLLLNFSPELIIYLAGQSSPAKSFLKKKETYLSNFVGCKNFLETISKYKIKCKFINSSSCEIFGNTKKKLGLKTNKKPISPYGLAKLKSFEITKKYRIKNKLLSYNAIIFNSESTLRNKKYLIPKICIAAIRAKKFGTKTQFGNLKIAREWNWCPEQCEYLLRFIKKKPQDFILSNGKLFTAIQMLKFAFGYFNLDYKNFILQNKKFFRKADSNFLKSDFNNCLKRNKIRRINKIYGKKLIYKLINYYLHEKKY
tara:strand:- start:52 stop:1008 length:957 start_codon:yes stop_codon:yes gene_type:complete